MKLKRIISLCKAESTIELINDGKNKVQYLANNTAVYQISGVTHITTDVICLMSDITEKKKSEMIIRTLDVSEFGKNSAYCIDDSIQTEMPASKGKLFLKYKKRIYTPFYYEHGVILVEEDYLKPLDSEEELFYTVRETELGLPYLCVKRGLLFKAAITPSYDIETAIREEIERLSESIKQTEEHLTSNEG